MDAEPSERSQRLPFRAPFAADTFLSFLGARAVPGIEEVRDGTYFRSVQQSGNAAVVAMTPLTDHVELRVSEDASLDLEHLSERTRRALDLDADPVAIDEGLSSDPQLAPLVARLPGIRVPGTFDGFELVVRAIFGQQVSVAGARTSLGRLVARAGTPLERPDGAITHLFPAAEQVAELPPEAFGMPRARADTIRRVAALVSDGQLDLSGHGPREETLSALGEVPGIGPWTLGYVAMRALHDPDAFIAGDLGVRKGFDALGLPSTPRGDPGEGGAMATLSRIRRDAPLARAPRSLAPPSRNSHRPGRTIRPMTRVRWIVLGVVLLILLGLGVLFWFNMSLTSVSLEEGGSSSDVDHPARATASTLDADEVRPDDRYRCELDGSSFGVSETPAPGRDSAAGPLTVLTAEDGTVTLTCVEF